MDSESLNSVGIIISPNTHKKIRARNAAMRLKHGVPQFKDVLRKRFLSRIKENRGRLIDQLRDVHAGPNETVLKVIQQEVSSIINTEDFSSLLDDEVRIRQEMEFESLEEQDQWLLQQYDLLMADDNALQELWEETQLVVCPVCRKGNLHCDSFNSKILCEKCPLAVPARAALSEVRDRIYSIIHQHEYSGCQGETLFFVSPEDASVYAHCNICSYLDLAV